MAKLSSNQLSSGTLDILLKRTTFKKFIDILESISGINQEEIKQNHFQLSNKKRKTKKNNQEKLHYKRISRTKT